jgi:hypothetical protein
MNSERKSKCRIEAEMIRRCAEKFSVTDRAVRGWRTRNDSRWIEFLKSEASRDITEIEAVALRADLESSCPEDEEKSATRRFLLLQRELDIAVERGQMTAVPVLTRAAESAHKFLSTIRASRVEHDTQMGKLVPARQVTEIRTRVLQPLHNIMANMPMEAGPRCNTFDADFAIRALQEWLHDRFTPELDAAMRIVDEISS